MGGEQFVFDARNVILDSPRPGASSSSTILQSAIAVGYYDIT